MEKMKNKDLRRRANLEEEERGDILFLPVIDSNESDCEKLQLLSKHVIENLEFDFLLLVEDDTFVYLDNVVQMLNRQTSHNLWWTDFTSIPWPKASQLPSLLMPKGPAMVLSRSLVEYISHNGPYLKTFPSLLSSLAIWFAGLDIQTLSNKHWSQRIPVNVTDIRGDGSKLAFQGVSPKLMRSVWASSISNSNSKQGVQENFGWDLQQPAFYNIITSFCASLKVSIWQDPHNSSSQLKLLVMVLYQYFIWSVNMCIDLILLYISDG